MTKLESQFHFALTQSAFYHCFVHDTFCLFQSREEALFFFAFLNNIHPNARFTLEEENDLSVPFLDLNIRRSSQTFQYEVFRMSCHTSLISKFILSLLITGNNTVYPTARQLPF